MRIDSINEKILHCETLGPLEETFPIPGGTQFRDPRGGLWTMRQPRPIFARLDHPPPGQRYWSFTLGAQHPAQTLEQGEELQRIWRRDEINARRLQLQQYFAAEGADETFVAVSEGNDALVVRGLDTGPDDIEGLPIRYEG
jgi:hypothetical protein